MSEAKVSRQISWIIVRFKLFEWNSCRVSYYLSLALNDEDLKFNDYFKCQLAFFSLFPPFQQLLQRWRFSTDVQEEKNGKTHNTLLYR